jgi:hypothetical protein
MQNSRSFDLGRVFGDCLLVLRRLGIPFIAVTMVAMSPMLVLSLLLRDVFERTQQPPEIETRPGEQPDFGPILDLYRDIGIYNGSITLLEVLLTPIATACIMFGTFRCLRGREAQLGECFADGLRHLVPLIGFGLIYLFCFGGGLVLCCLPGLFAAVALAVAAPAIVVESLSSWGGVKRSWSLVRPQFWWTLLTLVLLFMLNFIPGIVVGIFSMTLETIPTLVLVWALRTLTIALSAVVTCSLYAELRRLSGSIDDDDYGDIFA